MLEDWQTVQTIKMFIFAFCNYPFRVDIFSEGTMSEGEFTRSYRSCLPCIKWQKIEQVYSVPLTLILLFTTTPTFANSVDPDHMASEEAI